MRQYDISIDQKMRKAYQSVVPPIVCTGFDVFYVQKLVGGADVFLACISLSGKDIIIGNEHSEREIPAHGLVT